MPTPKASQVAVITGSSTGIGAALARRLAARGMRVGLIALPGTGLEDVAASIRAAGGVAACAEADVGDREASRSALGRLGEELGPIDLLVLNAGLGGQSLVATHPAENGKVTSTYADRVERIVQINLVAPAYAIEAVVPGMIERGRGHIVGTSSLSSFRGQPVVSGYCASKAALAVLLEGLRIELKPLGIDVTIVRPGFVRTPMTAGIPSPRGMIGPEEAARFIDEGIVARRREVAFPWQASILMRLLGTLPNALYDRVATATILKKFADKPANPIP